MYGIGGLRVVDASIFPTITTGNTNAPVTMVAERAAYIITEYYINNTAPVTPIKPAFENAEHLQEGLVNDEL